MKGHATTVPLAAALAVTLISSDARAQVAVSLYGGIAKTTKSDVALARPGGTDLKFAGASWTDESFQSPIYYGFRLSYWIGGRTGRWGLALDFTHAKMYADLEDTVAVSGQLNGSPVNGSQRLGDTFQALAFSHGHNLLTLNGIYRWFPTGERDGSFLGRLQPYVGLGVGVAIPHVEANVDGTVTDEYRVSGPAFEGRAGANFDVVRYLSAFAEYKLSYARIKGDLTGGGTIEAKPWTHQLVFGLSLNL